MWINALAQRSSLCQLPFRLTEINQFCQFMRLTCAVSGDKAHTCTCSMHVCAVYTFSVRAKEMYEHPSIYISIYLLIHSQIYIVTQLATCLLIYLPTYLRIYVSYPHNTRTHVHTYTRTHAHTHTRQSIPLGVSFSKAQSSKLEHLFCHVSVKR